MNTDTEKTLNRRKLRERSLEPMGAVFTAESQRRGDDRGGTGENQEVRSQETEWGKTTWKMIEHATSLRPSFRGEGGQFFMFRHFVVADVVSAAGEECESENYRELSDIIERIIAFYHHLSHRSGPYYRDFSLFIGWDLF